MPPPEASERGARLREAASALGLALDDAGATRLLAFLDILQHWNATYNLTAIRDPDRMLTQHVVDCMSAVSPLRRTLEGRAELRILDVGSGGGLPGAVIAMLCPAMQVTCVDAVGKKAAFVQHIAAQLRLANLHARHARVEELREPSFDVITSRAFASLKDFARLTRPLLGVGGVWMAMKGQRPVDELASLDSSVDVFHVEQLVVPGLGAERCLVWMRPSPSL